ncbi:2-polyprenyl-6-methoxyphenol hydroxylase-like FAD-dependent oxidoreductase [Amycolatopsis bartoniae]|uniref:FAD-dependent oxidoreductase n=1 Tax=Amycolatopsis bartoniae TaxID=941986 RepID=A0A8H9M444_9PSEU|nr:FAD-dependent monooxygenase [Amycolatopsis bartoniae]MBB2934761.1 2-polyprenyl-6-methoxyphenol hydroxylase-like FAD-dependent oxidoreductase [Amycolatopsis bartoniae]TVT01179.1 FAD-dependent oxidoreductase [Amycolatopsis bartoniae]GHF44949.1 FAD-dependent oxidoreductase [Amycolatopsis bartoniae]
MRILISGASIAGPALAFWLARQGHDVTVVEKAPALREGGQAVDFKGDTHLAVLRRMGLLDDVRRLATGGRDQTIVDAGGRRLAIIPGEFTGGDVEIRRGDLSRLLYDRTKDTCRYVFGDSIRSLRETATGVDVTFERSEAATFDLVVGADGIHSNVRRLVFGPEPEYVRFLGHYYALADLDVPGDAVMYNEPGRMAALGGPKAPAFFVFASPELDYDRYDVEQQKRLLARAYEGGGWRIPELMARLPEARDVYLDSLSRVELEHYSRGRVVLVGDAAYGNTLGGFGTGLAVVAAYVLAGELACGDHATAFRRYEEQLRPYAEAGRRGNAGPFLAPGSKLRLRMRNWTFRSPLLLRWLLKVTDRLATDIELREYEVRTPDPTEVRW